jgi:hypothetical protein
MERIFKVSTVILRLIYGNNIWGSAVDPVLMQAIDWQNNIRIKTPLTNREPENAFLRNLEEAARESREEKRQIGGGIYRVE